MMSALPAHPSRKTQKCIVKAQSKNKRDIEVRLRKYRVTCCTIGDLSLEKKIPLSKKRKSRRFGS